MAAAVRELDICSPGSFFGMTFFGDPRYFKSNARKPFEKEVYEYPLEKFLTAFKEMASLHKNPTCCRRANLPKIFAMAMGRELEDYELDFVLKFLDFGPALRPGNLDFNEFKYGVEHMIKMGLNKCNKPKSFILGDGQTPVPPPLQSSYSIMQEDHFKHRRKKVGPTCEYRKSITGNHDLGWNHDLDPVKGARTRTNKWNGRHRTDVTFNEGICLDNYYGIIL
ncbi:unnamed protein product [Sphagnum compactum]